jgi:hypothetical protein
MPIRITKTTAKPLSVPEGTLAQGTATEEGPPENRRPSKPINR